MATSMQGYTIWAMPAGGDLSGDLFKFVKITTGKVALASTGDTCIGVLIEEAGAADVPCTVQLDGVAKVIVGSGGVTAGAPVKSDSGGLAIAASTGDHSPGIALVTGVQGDIVPVLLGAGGQA